MRKLISSAVFLLLALSAAGSGAWAALPTAKPESVGMSAKRLAFLDEIVGAAIARNDFHT